jgi:hypothetical protein
MRAASIVPSCNGINACSMTRTVLGKVVTIIRRQGPRDHGTVQCDPTQVRQVDVPVMLPDSEPQPEQGGNKSSEFACSSRIDFVFG